MKTQTETETKHTPGTWYLSTLGTGDRIEVSANQAHPSDRHIASVHGKDGEGRANAALIVASPLMLEALEQATILLKHAWDDPALLHSQLADETAATMTEALEQATGKEL